MHLILLSILSCVRASEAKSAAQVSPCSTPKCIQSRAELVALGYDSSIAERIVVYRPDLHHLITHPEIQIHPGSFMNAFPPGHPSFSPGWFESQVQDRKPVTVYRGIISEAKSFNPTYFYKGGMPIYDPRVFTGDETIRKKALGYAMRPGKEGLFLEMQLPRFMLYEKEGGPYGTVYFRDLVPNDFQFVKGVATIPAQSFSPESKNALVDEIDQKLTFESFEKAYPKLAQVPLVKEARISPSGGFAPSRAWSDSICTILDHPEYKKHFGNSKLDGVLRNVIQDSKTDSKLWRETLAESQLKVESMHPKSISTISEKGSHACSSTVELVRMITGATASATVNDPLYRFVVESVQHCLNAKALWLKNLN